MTDYDCSSLCKITSSASSGWEHSWSPPVPYSHKRTVCGDKLWYLMHLWQVGRFLDNFFSLNISLALGKLRLVFLSWRTLTKINVSLHQYMSSVSTYLHVGPLSQSFIPPYRNQLLLWTFLPWPIEGGQIVIALAVSGQVDNYIWVQTLFSNFF